ncbi:MAG TPA: BTAD domain-containing putative transcriptional regulator, partial [Nakamurella sp.]
MIEACAEALLELGHPEVVGPELRALAEEHPFRERLWSLVAISQYQTLRQADALGTLRTLRERLADELGVDPSPQVRELELAVLNHSAGLAAPLRVALAAAPAGPDSASPRPPRTRGFPGLVGRAAAIAALTR